MNVHAELHQYVYGAVRQGAACCMRDQCFLLLKDIKVNNLLRAMIVFYYLKVLNKSNLLKAMLFLLFKGIKLKEFIRNKVCIYFKVIKLGTNLSCLNKLHSYVINSST